MEGLRTSGACGKHDRVARISTSESKREMRKLLRRQAILTAARRSFLDDGYAATSMSGLLKTLGGSKSTLWDYFKSKEELFASVIEDVTLEVREQLEGSLVTSEDLEATLQAFCRAFMNRLALPDVLAVWRLVMAESGHFPGLGKVFYDRAARHVERLLANFLDKHIAAGTLVDEGSLSMARLLIGLCNSDQSRKLWGVVTTSPAESASQIDQDAQKFTRYFLRLFRQDAQERL